VHRVSANKFTRAQADASEPAHATNTGDRYGIGIGENTTPELEAADRALTSVARKLDASISVEYVVNDLIMTAANEKNLARIFQGPRTICVQSAGADIPGTQDGIHSIKVVAPSIQSG